MIADQKLLESSVLQAADAMTEQASDNDIYVISYFQSV